MILDQVDKIKGEPKDKKDFIEKREVNHVKGIYHIKLDQHPLLLSLMARMHYFRLMEKIVTIVVMNNEEDLYV